MSFRTRRWLTVAGCAGVLLVVTAVPAAGLTNEVKLDSYAFDPPIRRLSPGESIRFRGHAPQAHTATSADGIWDSGPLTDGQTYTVTFVLPGEYRYFCRFHPSQMTGTILVEGAPPTPSATAPPVAAAGGGTGAGGGGGAAGVPAAAPPASAAPAASEAPPTPVPATPEPSIATPAATVAAAEPEDAASTASAPAPRSGPPSFLLLAPAVLALAGMTLVLWEAVERRRRGY